MFAGPSVHPRHAGPCLPCFPLSNPETSVVNINVVVASTLPGEALNMQEFGAVSVYNDYAFTFCWKELINLSYHANKWRRRGMTPQGRLVSGRRKASASKPVGGQSKLVVRGTARPGSATPLLSFQVSQTNHSALLHLSTLLLPSCLFRCN